MTHSCVKEGDGGLLLQDIACSVGCAVLGVSVPKMEEESRAKTSKVISMMEICQIVLQSIEANFYASFTSSTYPLWTRMGQPLGSELSRWREPKSDVRHAGLHLRHSKRRMFEKYENFGKQEHISVHHC